MEVEYPLDPALRDLVLEIERVSEDLQRDVATLKARGAADDIMQASCAKLVARAKESLTRRHGTEFAVRHLEMTRNSLVTAYRQVRAKLTRMNETSSPRRGGAAALDNRGNHMTDESRPYVPAEESLPELTLKALLLGVVVAALLGAANAYLGFKAGQTVSATFPAAVLAIAAFRLPFFRGSVLEQNTMRTAASVGEALAAGAIFTIPAFVMVNVGGQRLWTGFNYWETSLILLVGGLLGILFIILLRRTLDGRRGPAVPREPRLRRDREDGPEGRHRRALRLRRDGPRDADPGLQGPGRHPRSSARACASSRSSRPRSSTTWTRAARRSAT